MMVKDEWENGSFMSKVSNFNQGRTSRRQRSWDDQWITTVPTSSSRDSERVWFLRRSCLRIEWWFCGEDDLLDFIWRMLFRFFFFWLVFWECHLFFGLCFFLLFLFWSILQVYLSQTSDEPILQLNAAWRATNYLHQKIIYKILRAIGHSSIKSIRHG